jgi:quinol monooxygenase YgiN
MVISTLRFRPSTDRRSEALEVLRSVVGPTESEPGCLSCRIYQEEGPDQATVFCGHWESPEALQQHILSDLYLRLLAACELSSQPPEFCFHHVSKTQGLELVHKLRARRGKSSPSMEQN